MWPSTTAAGSVMAKRYGVKLLTHENCATVTTVIGVACFSITKKMELLLVALTLLSTALSKTGRLADFCLRVFVEFLCF